VLELSLAQFDAAMGAVLFPLVRILALLFSAPVLGQAAVPVRLRIALGLLLALLAAATVPGAPGTQGPDALGTVVREALIGFALGLAMRLIFAAAELAGEAIGLQMGLGFAMFVDPQSAGQTPVIASLYALLAAMLFFALDIHLLLIAGVMESFVSFPIGAAAAFGQPEWRSLAGAGSELFRLALALSLPPMTGLLLANIALGMLSRSAPQLNLFAVGFPAMLLVGILLLAPTLPGAAEALSRALMAWPLGR